MHFASFDLTVSKESEIRDLMHAWSEAVAKMCSRQPVGGENNNAFVPPEDTGEAQDLTAGHLTITSTSGSGKDRTGCGAEATWWRAGSGCS